MTTDESYYTVLTSYLQCRCVVEVMTAVSLLSSDTVFLQPYKEEEKKKAGQAHRRFASREGDLLTLITIYEAWTKVRLTQSS